MALIGLIVATAAFSPLRGVRPTLAARPVVDHVRVGVAPTMMPDSNRQPVPLTGQTLQASLKLRCDTTGAAYAIYWSEQSGVLKEIGYYAATPGACVPAAMWHRVAMDPALASHTRMARLQGLSCPHSPAVRAQAPRPTPRARAGTRCLRTATARSPPCSAPRRRSSSPA